METCPWVEVQMQTDSLGEVDHTPLSQWAYFSACIWQFLPFPWYILPPPLPQCHQSGRRVSYSFSFVWVVHLSSHLNKNYLSVEKFADFRFKLLVVDFYLFFLLLFICLWNTLSEIHHNLAVILFCGGVAGGPGVSKQWVLVSHSLHVTPYGTSGLGDGAVSVQPSLTCRFLFVSLSLTI